MMMVANVSKIIKQIAMVQVTSKMVTTTKHASQPCGGAG